jgi:hypothetical protein
LRAYGRRGRDFPPSVPEELVVSRRPTRVCIVAAIGLISGCDLPFGTGCDSVLLPGLRIDVVDSASSTAIPPAAGARVIARAGAYADTATLQSSRVALAYERAGTYTVFVEHPAYRPWSRGGVRVREDDCHVVPTELTARLQPQP